MILVRHAYHDTAKVTQIVQANSIGFGANASSPSKAWPVVFRNKGCYAGRGISVRNASVSGIGVSQNPEGNGSLISLAPTLVDPFLTSKLNLIFTHEGPNETKGNGNNGAQVFEAYKPWCAARRAAAAAAGGEAILALITCTPSAPPTATQTAINNKHAALKAFNDVSRRKFRDCFDYLIDVAEHEPFKSMFAKTVLTPADSQASGMYNGQAFDGLHPGDAGYDWLATIVAEHSRRILLPR